MEWLIVVILIGIVVITMAWRGFLIVQQAETLVVERLGRYHRTVSSGINILWPFFDKPRRIYWRYDAIDVDGRRTVQQRLRDRIDLRETVYDFPKQNVITKDNVAITIDALLYFQVTDPTRAVYEIENLPNAIEKLTQTTLRNVIGDLHLDQTLTSRDTINARLRTILDEAADKWGVKVNRVELQDITPPPDIKDAMEKQMRAERDRRAAILEAEGHRQSVILIAEGDQQAEIAKAEGIKRATVLVAEGQADARLRVAEAEAESIRRVTETIRESRGNPASYLIAVKYLETLKEMVSGKDGKTVYVPYEASGILGSVGLIRELFPGNGHAASGEEK